MNCPLSEGWQERILAKVQLAGSFRRNFDRMDSWLTRALASVSIFIFSAPPFETSKCVTASAGLAGGWLHAIVRRGPQIRWALATSASFTICEASFAGMHFNDAAMGTQECKSSGTTVIMLQCRPTRACTKAALQRKSSQQHYCRRNSRIHSHFPTQYVYSFLCILYRGFHTEADTELSLCSGKVSALSCTFLCWCMWTRRHSFRLDTVFCEIEGHIDLP